jgi:hypothetical protein
MSDVAELDERMVADYAKRYRDAIQPHVDEPVEAVGAFRRSGNYLLSTPLLGRLASACVALYERLHRGRASSLPTYFLLAVTPRTVHVFKHRPHARGRVRLGREVMAWSRAQVVVAGTTERAISCAVTLELRDGDGPRKIVCDTDKLVVNPWGARVLELLDAPAREPASRAQR